MRKLAAVAISLVMLSGCAVHYVQQMESHKDKLVMTTIKQTNLLFFPISSRQTVEVCDVEGANAIKCQEAMVDYGDNPL